MEPLIDDKMHKAIGDALAAAAVSGRHMERELIVAWLQSTMLATMTVSDTWAQVAMDIEQGEHLK